MAIRTLKILSIAPHITEGAGIQRDEAKVLSSISALLPPAESDPLVHQLQHFDQQLEDSGWRDSAAMLVFPTHEVSIRRLEFPFREQKKIDQALVFELDNELLDEVDAFARAYSIVPNDDGSSLVLVYLVPNDYLQAFLGLMQDHRLVPVKATFSAQALQEAHPAPENGWHYQLYIGYDEVFVSCIVDGALYAIKSFPNSLPGFSGQEAPASAGDVLSWLSAANGSSEEGGGGNGGLPQQDWIASLGQLANGMMQFIRSHSLGQPFTLSMHGLFSCYFAWDAETGELSVEAPSDPRAAFSGTIFLGILDEVLADPAPVTGTKGINFSAGRTGLVAQVKEFRRPLTAMAALLAGLIVLGGINFALGISSKHAELARLDAGIQQTLKGLVPGNPPPEAGVRLLEERLRKLKQKSAASERFAGYHYEAMSYLQDVSALLKNYPQLTLTSLGMNAERYTISGTTGSYDASEKFKNALGAIKRFGGKEPVITHQRSSANISYRIIINR
jgi:hypothetical protein